MQITDRLIEKFLANKCTTAEAVFVADYLEKNPDVMQAYLQRAWEEAGNSGPVEKEEYESMLQAVRSDLFERRSFYRQGYFKWLAVAASLLLLIGTWRLLGNKKEEVATGKNRMAASAMKPAVKWLVKYNTGDESLRFVLADHSEVTLSPGAILQYTETFPGNKRDIYLQGEAFFEVAKDPFKPFTVYAGSFATTALGTSFRVTESQGDCKVKLYTGKVVIRSTSPGVTGWNKDVFLLPGQQMNYDSSKGLVAISRYDAEPVTGNRKSKDNDVLRFVNTRLAEVLDKLAERYKQDIDYNKAETEGMYFTGSVLKTDSLPVILNVIARMNGLIISKKADGFLIKKSQ